MCPSSRSIASISLASTAATIWLRTGLACAFKSERHLARAGITIEGGAIRVLCMLWVLGSVFNPLSVFLCHSPAGQSAGQLRAVLYGVNNTFGHRHSYLIPARDSADGLQRQSCRKSFCVSPFMEMGVQYRFRLAPSALFLRVAILGSGAAIGFYNSRAAIAIEAHDYAGLVLSACFGGRRAALSMGNLSHWYLRHPVLALQVLGIHGEAGKLWLKSMRLHPRPKPPGDPISIVSAGTQRGSTA